MQVLVPKGVTQEMASLSSYWAKRMFAVGIIIWSPTTLLFADTDLVHSNQVTTETLARKNLCRIALFQVAREISQLPADRPLEISIERRLNKVIASMAEHHKISTDQAHALREKLITLLKTKFTTANRWLGQSLEAVQRDEMKRTFNDMDLWLCTGINCQLTHGAPANEIHMPFNYVVADTKAASNPGNLESRVVQQDVIKNDLIKKGRSPDRLPSPAIGLSRVETVFIEPPSTAASSDLDQWLSEVLKETSIYVVHQDLSKWTSRNHFLEFGSKKMDPLYSQNFERRDRLYVIDPAFYWALTVGIKYQAKLEALRALDPSFDSKSESLVRDQAWMEFQAKIPAETLQRFEARNQIKLTPQNLFETANIWLSAIQEANKQVQLSGMHVYPDHSFGIMPLRMQIGNP